jgi:uncharacterized surface protein with fasciclin (FAS1) repeats
MKPTNKENGALPSTANPDTQAAEATSPVRRSARRSARPARERTRREGTPYAVSLLERCASIPKLHTFSDAIGFAGLSDLLSGEGPITIFAPTDRAFDKIPPVQRSALLQDPARLAELIRHHVVTGRVKAPQETKPRSVTPDFGDALKLTASSAGFQVGAARIVKTNIRATNGVIHAIDTVLELR